LLAKAGEGNDPSAERHEARKALTVAELCGCYLEAAKRGLVTTRFRREKQPSTIAIDEGRIVRHIAPLIGSHAAGKLNRATVQRMADAIASGKTAGIFKTKARGKAVVAGGASTAARTVELLGGIWSWAEKRGFVSGTNPARGVDKHQSAPKDRTLDPHELARLGETLRGEDTLRPMAVAAVRLIALTGLRHEEACGLRWREIDFAGSCLRLETTKTGTSIRPVGRDAINLLSAIPRGNGEWIFPNRDGRGSADLKKSIAAIFNLAGLPDARSHDLRRTFASFAAGLGYGDAAIAELMGHARRGVTERHYVRRPDAVLVEAASRTAQIIAAALETSSNCGKRCKRLRAKAAFHGKA
jgi:integrase